MLSLTGIWLWCILGSLTAYTCMMRNKWLAPFTLPIPLILFWNVIAEMHASHVNPAIGQEAGTFYVISAYTAPIIFIAAHIAGYKAHQRNLAKLK